MHVLFAAVYLPCLQHAPHASVEAAPRRWFRIDSTAQTHAGSPAGVGGPDVCGRRESATPYFPISKSCMEAAEMSCVLCQARTAHRPLLLYMQETARTDTTCCLADMFCPREAAAGVPRAGRIVALTLAAVWELRRRALRRKPCVGMGAHSQYPLPPRRSMRRPR